MASPYITKSDFKVAADCRTKLFYRKNGYPTNLDENEYLRFLADGGFMVEFIAKARFPTGIDLVDDRDPLTAFETTRRLMEEPNVVLFEAAATIGKFHIRADILEKTGNVLNLIEVKSSSIDEEDDDDAASPFLTKKGAVVSRWKKYLSDVAFQTHVLQLAFPDLVVRPYLCVVDKSQIASDSETLGHFLLTKDSRNPKARPTVRYAGDLTALRNSRLLVTRPVEHEVDLLMPEVLQKAEILAAILTGDCVTRIQEDITQQYNVCRKCDFRTDEAGRNGFRECWGELAESPSHILDLHRVAQIGSAKVADPVTPLLQRGLCSYLDLEVGELGSENSYQRRRLMQWQSMRAGGTECLPRALQISLAGHETAPGLPLHFVDFEACDLSLPHHAGLRPYERVAFQWSCHTVNADGTLSHQEWLNTARNFPNFAFAQSLSECVGETGTVYVWSPYEQTTLKKVLRQIDEWNVRDRESALRLSGLPDYAALDKLASWIDRLLGPEDGTGKRHSARIQDLHKLAYEHYFHPRMAGRTSIKVVLPAVWESDEKVRAHPCFVEYVRFSAEGKPLDPYKALSPLPFGDDEDNEDVVREGTGAIRVYQDLIFCVDSTPQESANRQKLLLQYCGLDTAAMVIIWMHWTGRYEIKRSHDSSPG